METLTAAEGSAIVKDLIDDYLEERIDAEQMREVQASIHEAIMRHARQVTIERLKAEGADYSSLLQDDLDDDDDFMVFS